MQAIWDFIVAHWSAILLGGAGIAAAQWCVSFLTGEKASEFVHQKLEELRTKMNENSVLSQIAADDALVNILESAIPVVLHDLGDEAHKDIAAGNLTNIDWKAFGKKLYGEVKATVEGGVNDYLKNSSHKDGEVLAAMIAEKFFKTQKMQAKGLISDAPRAAIADVTTTTTQAVAMTRSIPPEKVVSEEVHTQVGTGA